MALLLTVPKTKPILAATRYAITRIAEFTMNGNFPSRIKVRNSIHLPSNSSIFLFEQFIGAPA
jgi:hypothetical protein